MNSFDIEFVKFSLVFRLCCAETQLFMLTRIRYTCFLRGYFQNYDADTQEKGVGILVQTPTLRKIAYQLMVSHLSRRGNKINESILLTSYW